MARDAFLDAVFDRCRCCPFTVAPLMSSVGCNDFVCDVVFVYVGLDGLLRACPGCCGLICSCKFLVAAAVGFAVAIFPGGRDAVETGRLGTEASSLAPFARDPLSVLLRCTTGRFIGVVDSNPNSSSEGTSKTSGLVVAARVLTGSPADPAVGTFAIAATLCGRSGEGASSSKRLGRGGGRRDDLPYVIAFFRLSPVVEVDDVKDAMMDAFVGVFAIQKVGLGGRAHRDGEKVDVS